MTIRIPSVFCAGLLALALTGCGKKPLAYNDNVKGTVKLDGVPLANVHLQFVPQLGFEHEAPQARAVTDENGEYQLVSDNGRRGAVIGAHRVTVMRGGSVRPSEQDRRPVSTVALLPRAYGSIAETPLTVEVRPNQNVYDLEMKSEE